ncbi:MAG: RNA polymerase sigma-70 factor, partial [Tannerellaceae bacterium]|nr:RNA polymerase sigma-70 factor [Tannerellaceae bacterium]
MTDQELFTKLQSGDENAYKNLFLKYYAPLREFASQYVLDNEAEEIVQDLMLHIW